MSYSTLETHFLKIYLTSDFNKLSLIFKNLKYLKTFKKSAQFHSKNITEIRHPTEKKKKKPPFVSNDR